MGPETNVHFPQLCEKAVRKCALRGFKGACPLFGVRYGLQASVDCDSAVPLFRTVEEKNVR
jgi:hypothetical protein